MWKGNSLEWLLKNLTVAGCIERQEDTFTGY